MKFVKKITIDVNAEPGHRVVKAKQADNKTRYVNITITEDGKRFNLGGLNTRIRCEKPDGNICYNPATVQEDGTVEVELTKQILAVPGDVKADICIFDDDDAMLSTASFIIYVEKAPYGEDAESSSEFLNFVNFAEETRKNVKSVSEAAIRAENAAGTAEQAKGAAEDARKAASAEVSEARRQAEAAAGHADNSATAAAASGKEAKKAADAAAAAEAAAGNATNAAEEAANNVLEQAKASGVFNGPTGRGVASVTGNEDGSWTFTYTDGTTEAVSSEAYTALTTQLSRLSLEIAGKEQLVPEFANTVEECVDTSKLYVLPDGYIYAYTKEGGYTNHVSLSTDADGSVFNETGYQDGYCLNYSTSGALLTQLSDHTTMGFVPVLHTDTIRMSGVTWGATNKNVIAFFDDNKKPLGCYTGNGYVTKASAEYSSEGIAVLCLGDKSEQSVTTENGVTTFNMTFQSKDTTNTSGGTSGRSGQHVKYVRISAQGNGANMVVTVNEEIEGAAEGGYKWRSTGHAFVPADYESRIVALEEAEETHNAKIKKNAADIQEISQKVKNILDGSTSVNGSEKFDPTDYGLPVLYLIGDTTGMSKDNEVTLNYKYGDLSGSCTLKWQGSSSIAYDKKNYTIKLDTKTEIVDGWGVQKKYCLKANYIDHTHARNVVSAKLWGEIVASRKPSNATLAACPNYGAVDGFPIAIMLNGEFHGLYTWNIPKDGWTFNMDDGANEAVICANYTTPAVNLRVHAKVDGSDHELEYVSDEDNAAWVANSLNNVIDMCVNSYGADIDTTIAQYLDWESAIDYYILTVLVDGRDMVNKNYIMATWDGAKWVFSAYDMDSTYGLHWDGSALLPPNAGVSFASFRQNRVMELVYRFKTNALKNRYKALRADVLSEYHLNEIFENFVCGIPSRLLQEDVKKWPSIPSTAANTLGQILRWMHLRLQIVDKWVDELPEQETPVAPADRVGNAVPTAIDTNGSVYNGTGFKDGYILNIASDGTASEAADDGCTISGFIPVTKNNTIRVTTDHWNVSPTPSRIIFYNASFEPMAYYTQHGYVSTYNGYTHKTAIQAKDMQSVTYSADGLTTLNIAYGASCADLAYFRIVGVGKGANMAVLVE